MNRRNPRSKPARSRIANRSRVLHSDLMETNQLLRNQLTSEEPLVKDIQFPQLAQRKIYTIQDSFVGPTITGSTTLEVDGALSLSLSSLADASSYAAIFDAYRFIAVKMVFNPITFSVEGAIGAPIYTALDYDDSSNTSVSALTQYSTLKVAPPNKYFERSFTPRIAGAVYSGAFTSFSQETYRWIDTVSNGVQQYGIKWGIPLSGTPSSWATTVHVVVQFRFKR